MAVFTRIAVPVDGSDPSNAALRLALALAKDQGATLTLFHVVELNRIAAIVGVGATTVDPSPMFDAVREAGKSVLDDASQQCAAAGVQVVRTMLEGDTVGSLLDACRSCNAQLIVMGSHGRSGVVRALFGSVAEGVLRHAPVPVLITRG
jgi:nucleotide-binding universal stress UspA family protein